MQASVSLCVHLTEVAHGAGSDLGHERVTGSITGSAAADWRRGALATAFVAAAWAVTTQI